MKTSPAGIAYIESQEGGPLTVAKWDVNGYAAGYGHHAGVTKDTTATQAQADAWLTEDLTYQEAVINASPVVNDLSQDGFDALVDLGYNAGPKKIQPALDDLEVDDPEAAKSYILSINKANGVYLPQLAARRQHEVDALDLDNWDEKKKNGKQSKSLWPQSSFFSPSIFSAWPYQPQNNKQLTIN